MSSSRPMKRLLDNRRYFIDNLDLSSVADSRTTRPISKSVPYKTRKIEGVLKERNTSSHFTSRLIY